MSEEQQQEGQQSGQSSGQSSGEEKKDSTTTTAGQSTGPVPYTHLTLPTNREV